MPAPLEGIRVLDFTRFQNGPHATVMLSDMGADVLKVERPGSGDPGRALGRRPDGFSGYFEALDRGKKSITLDFGGEEGRKIIHQLVEQADVVTENFKPGLMDSLQLGYEDLKKVNPRLIYAVNSGFGPTGPWADKGSFDIVAQGMSGAMLSQGGGPDAEPIQINWGLADQVGSMVFAYGIMTAIVARERHGVGQKVDISQLGAMVTLQTLSFTSFLHTGEQFNRGPRGNPTFTYYQGSDGGWFTIGVLTPKFWDGLCAALERPDLLTDERCAEPFARFENAAWLLDELGAAFKAKPRDHWMDALREAEVPCGPIYDYAEAVDDEQIWANDYLVDLDHPSFEGHRAVGVPVSFSETPGGVQGPAPELGQHTEETLLELGYDWDQISALRDNAVI
ncbi:MAG TPA: CoA transferase [Dehalococcoidia bacterium]|nr:CoA transferase [Dehalococcoidia bacterium]